MVSKLMKLSKTSAIQSDAYDSGSYNVRIPEQNQLQSAVSNQLTANNGNATEQPVFGSSFFNESELIGHDLWRQLLFQCFWVIRELQESSLNGLH